MGTPNAAKKNNKQTHTQKENKNSLTGLKIVMDNMEW